MKDRISILGFAGSLRKDSYNKALLVAASSMMPGDATLQIFDLEGIPPYNQDLEGDLPPRVREFKEKIRAADALLIATPEYNYSMPGVLKNAIDWASRPPGDNAFDGKPAAIMGATIGMLGTARAQGHLRQTFVFLNVHALNSPEVMVPMVTNKFKKGILVDVKTKEILAGLLGNLVAWARKFSQ